jgi:hypothetical protein
MKTVVLTVVLFTAFATIKAQSTTESKNTAPLPDLSEMIKKLEARMKTRDSLHQLREDSLNTILAALREESKKNRAQIAQMNLPRKSESQKLREAIQTLQELLDRMERAAARPVLEGKKEGY